jgi:hypothetical protein
LFLAAIAFPFGVSFASRRPSTWRCFVYSAKDTKSKRIGYLARGAAIEIADDGSGWLEIPTWFRAIAPVIDLKTNDFLDEALMKRPMYFEASNFTETPPRFWGQ